VADHALGRRIDASQEYVAHVAKETAVVLLSHHEVPDTAKLLVELVEERRLVDIGLERGGELGVDVAVE
jgi:hypothetical protein